MVGWRGQGGVTGKGRGDVEWVGWWWKGGVVLRGWYRGRQLTLPTHPDDEVTVCHFGNRVMKGASAECHACC